MMTPYTFVRHVANILHQQPRETSLGRQLRGLLQDVVAGPVHGPEIRIGSRMVVDLPKLVAHPDGDEVESTVQYQELRVIDITQTGKVVQVAVVGSSRPKEVQLGPFSAQVPGSELSFWIPVDRLWESGALVDFIMTGTP